MQTHGEVLRAEGEAEGRAKGIIEGKTECLTRYLEARFGGLPDEVRSMIGTADAPQLDRWTVMSVNAPTLDAVFNGHNAG